jgi:hypothetical protein
MSILLALRARMTRRPPDKIIKNLDGSVYLYRWHVIPRNPFFNIYLHHFCSSDDDRALHDHPWLFNASIIVEGSYNEVLPHRTMRGWARYFQLREEVLSAGDWKFRWGKAPHRVRLFPNTFDGGEWDCWTLFITGPVVRKWGFYCWKGWVHWKIFTQLKDGVSTISKGCD